MKIGTDNLLLLLAGTFLIAGGCTENNANQKLAAQKALDFSISESETQAFPMNGFVEFDERVEVSVNTDGEDCYFATYEFQFDYDTTLFVEFRDGRPGFCSYGAILSRSFGLKILTDDEFPIGTQLEPVIQFQQTNPNNAIFQIGSEYFQERASDLQQVEILCRRDSCDGSLLRRRVGPSS